MVSRCSGAIRDIFLACGLMTTARHRIACCCETSTGVDWCPEIAGAAACRRPPALQLGNGRITAHSPCPTWWHAGGTCGQGDQRNGNRSVSACDTERCFRVSIADGRASGRVALLLGRLVAFHQLAQVHAWSRISTSWRAVACDMVGRLPSVASSKSSSAVNPRR